MGCVGVTWFGVWPCRHSSRGVRRAVFVRDGNYGGASSVFAMSSPSKKRKLNNGSTPAVKGLEYFFSKQRQNGAQKTNTPPAIAPSDAGPATEMTDEELARKLQAEWDQEDASERQAAQAKSRSTTGKSSETNSVKDSARDAQPLVLAASLARPGSKENPKPTLGLQSAGISEDTTSTSIPLDESPLTFDPSEYIAQLHHHWASEGGDASYALLTRCFVLVSGTTSRIKIVDTLVNCLRILIEGDPSSLLPAVRLRVLHCTSRLILLGLVSNKLHIAALRVPGARPRRFGNIQGPKERVWPR